MKIFVTWSLPYYWAHVIFSPLAFLMATQWGHISPYLLYLHLVKLFLKKSFIEIIQSFFQFYKISIRRMWLLLLHSLFIIVCQITYVNKLLPVDSSQNFQSFLTIWRMRLASLVTQPYLYPLICNNHPLGDRTGDVQVKSIIHFSLSKLSLELQRAQMLSGTHRVTNTYRGKTSINWV